MTPRRSRWLRLAARLTGLALVVYVVATQVRWHDEVVLADGARLSGRVSASPGGGWSVTPAAGGAAREVAPSEVRSERYGDRDIPVVAYGFRTLFSRLGEAPAPVALVLAAMVSLALLTAWRWRWLVRALGLALRGADAVRYTLYGIFFSLIVPGATGGDVVKAYYAARRTGVPTRAVVSVFVDRLVGLFALVLLAAGVLFVGPPRDGFGAPRVVVAAVLAAGVLGGVLVASRRVRRATGLSALLRRLPFQHVLAEVDAALRLYRSHPGALGLGVLVSLANHGAAAACAWVLARALGLSEVGLGDALAIVPVVSLLTAIPLLPGGWGVGELAFAYFLGPLGVAPSEAVGLSVVFRLATLASGVPGGVLWLASRESARGAEMRDAVERAEAEVEASEGTGPA